MNFHGLPDSERSKLLQHGAISKFKRGQLICVQGKDGTSIGFLLEGDAFVFQTIQGRELIFDFLSTGDCFGEVAFILGGNRTASIKAISTCEVLWITKAEVQSLMPKIPEFQKALLILLAERLFRTTRKASELASVDVTSRVLLTLRSLAVQHGQMRPDGIQFQLPAQRSLAMLAGTSREMINRALKQLEASKEIFRDGKSVTLPKSSRYAA